MELRLAIVVLCVFVLEVLGQEPHDFAKDLAECVKVSPINDCLKGTLSKLRPLMKTGIPELGIQSTEPLEVRNLNFHTRPGIGIEVDANFENVIVEGLSNFVTRYIRADIESRTLALSLFVPEIRIRGLYKAKGKVFLVDNLDGNGPFNTVLERVTATGRARIVPVKDKDGSRLTIKSTEIDFDIGNANVHLSNIFNGRFLALERSVNDFFNDNNQMIIRAVKPQIREEVEKLVSKVLNNAFSKLPFDFESIDAIPRRGGRAFRANRRF